MNNVRGLFPPLYGAPANGGGGGGGSIQVDTLPDASLEYKDKIVQYTGATTETHTNGYFYKCVEHTETAGETITVTYSWDNIDVMEVETGGGAAYATTPHKVGTYLGSDLWEQTILAPALVNWVAVTDNPDNSNVVNIFGLANTAGGDMYPVGTSVKYSKDYGVYVYGKINNVDITSVKHVTIQYTK